MTIPEAKREIEKIFARSKRPIYFKEIEEKIKLEKQITFELCVTLIREGKISFFRSPNPINGAPLRGCIPVDPAERGCIAAGLRP